MEKKEINEIKFEIRINELRNLRKKRVEDSLNYSFLLGILCFFLSFFLIDLLVKDLSLISTFWISVLIGIGIIPLNIIWTIIAAHFFFLNSVKKLKKELLKN